MQPEFITTDEPDPEDRNAVLTPLAAYNASKAGRPSDFRPLAILLRDPDSGAKIGGLWGRSYYDWLFVELLFVPETLRGQDIGTELMRRAEAVARERNCAGIWLDTFEFQARGFYEKLGFSLFGQLDDHPRGSPQYFMQKRL